jgi:hypothetical protein
VILRYVDIIKNGFNAVKRYLFLIFKKLTVLTINDLHSLTIHCPLNVNELRHKESVNGLLTF